MTTALVTGATAGIGASFVRRLAADGYDLVLVARDEARLAEVAREVREVYSRRAEVVPADLTDRSQVQRVADRLRDPDSPVDLLVNNAGAGLGRGFLSGDLADEERMFDLLCRAVLVLSHAAARAMRERRHGIILNVSSVAGFVPMGTYSAAKAWVTTFSESIAAELAPHGVRVIAVCPGFVHTEFHQRAELDMSTMPQRAWLNADDVVREALADVGRGRLISVPSTRYKAVVALARYAPRPLVRRLSGNVRERRTT
ncbi:MAG: SDR family NAD(P)-dependent oxidoreductase [Angustibacter sp.]